jgi:hypothetical protein
LARTEWVDAAVAGCASVRDVIALALTNLSDARMTDALAWLTSAHGALNIDAALDAAAWAVIAFCHFHFPFFAPSKLLAISFSNGRVRNIAQATTSVLS